uniref:Prokineticin 2 n=1 Tax=Aquila chrysaetos chrysaetos TaxID=223781 RepID=A0A663EKK7_AQUCH
KIGERCAVTCFQTLTCPLLFMVFGFFKTYPACDRDQQCGGGMCCAVSLWIRSLRMCTPMGNLGRGSCHPLPVPFSGRRMHHTCPCLPSLACVRTSPSKFKCLPDFRKEDVFF